jgi:tetratricopeptide (TPR) repeat protein
MASCGSRTDLQRERQRAVARAARAGYVRCSSRRTIHVPRALRLSFRHSFGLLLWLSALAFPALWLVHRGSPAAAVRAVEQAQRALGWAAIGAGTLAGLGLLLFPPFLPWLRLTVARLKERLSTDPGPLLEAQARLRNLETVPDHLLVGRALLQRGEPAPAVAHLARAVELDPDHLPCRFWLGRALAAVGDVPRAVEQLAAVVARDERHAFGEALLELGRLLVRGRDDARALAVLERCEQLFGPSPRALFYKARAQAGLSRHDAARASLRRAAQRPDKDRHAAPHDALYRARARVALLRGGWR